MMGRIRSDARHSDGWLALVHCICIGYVPTTTYNGPERSFVAIEVGLRNSPLSEKPGEFVELRT